MKLIITFLLFAFIFSAQAQAYEQLIDHVDKNGKKDGWWKIFLDQNWKEVDESKAVFSHYTTYVHGQNMRPMGPCGKKGWKLMGLEGEVKPVTGYAILLDGEYRWVKENGKISSIHRFNKGWYADCKEYNKSGKLDQHFDYSTQWKGIENNFLFRQYNKFGKACLYVWKQGKKGWTFYPLGYEGDTPGKLKEAEK